MDLSDAPPRIFEAFDRETNMGEIQLCARLSLSRTVDTILLRLSKNVTIKFRRFDINDMW